MLFFKRGPVVGDMMAAEIPLVLDLLVADLALHLPPHRVHVQHVLETITERN